MNISDNNYVKISYVWNILYMKISHNDFIHENFIYGIAGSFIYEIISHMK